MSASLREPVSSPSLQKQSPNEPARSKPRLLGIPQELRNKIVSTLDLNGDNSRVLVLIPVGSDQFSYLYNTTGPVARSIGLDLSSSRRHRWSDECCELTGYSYYLPQELCPPTKLPLLVCKQLRAEMGQDATRRSPQLLDHEHIQGGAVRLIVRRQRSHRGRTAAAHSPHCLQKQALVQ